MFLEERIFICNNKIFFLCSFSIYYFCNATFFHSGSVIKPPQPSSAIYGAPPPFTGHRLERVRVSNKKGNEVNIHCTAVRNDFVGVSFGVGTLC